MKRIFSLLFLLCSCAVVSAQHTTALRTKLQRAATAKQKVPLLHQLAEAYLYPYAESKNAADSAMYFAQQSAKLASQVQDAYATAHGQVLVSRAYTKQGKPAEAKQAAQKALELATAGNYEDVRGEALEELYNQYNFYEQIDEKTKVLEQALQAYEKKSTKKQLANILTTASDHYNYIGQNEKALQLGERALAAYKAVPDAVLTNIYRVMGNNYYTAGLNKKAIDYFLKGARYGEALNKEHELLSYIYNQLAIIYTQLGDNDLCLKYLYKSLDQAMTIGDKPTIYTALNNICGALGREKRFAESDVFLKKISRKYPADLPIDKVTLELCFLNNDLGLKNYPKAGQHCHRILQLVKANEKTLPGLFVFSLNTALARYYLAVKDLDNARVYLSKMKPFAEKSGGFNRKKTYYTLAFQVDSTQGNYLGAIANLNRVRVADDSLFDINKNNEISRLQIEYETEKKDKDIQLKNQNIRLLGKETELQKSKTLEAQKLRNISFGVIALIIIFLGVLYRAYLNKQRTNEILRRQQAEITDKNAILSHLLDEKEWLLKEIHHRVKNNLQIVISLLNSQSAYLKSKSAVNAIKDSQRRVHSMSLIHQKLYQNDNPSAINMKNYISELVYYLKDSFDEGSVDFRQDVADVNFDVSQVVPIGLILNEAITNSVKYAFTDAKRGVISIMLKQCDNDIYELIIADNGGGIHIDLDATDSLGMSLIQGLSNDLNGTLDIYNDNGAVIKIIFKRSYNNPKEERPV